MNFDDDSFIKRYIDNRSLQSYTQYQFTFRKGYHYRLIYYELIEGLRAFRAFDEEGVLFDQC